MVRRDRVFIDRESDTMGIPGIDSSTLNQLAAWQASEGLTSPANDAGRGTLAIEAAREPPTVAADDTGAPAGGKADDAPLRTDRMRERMHNGRTAAPALAAPRTASGYRFVYRSSYNYSSGGHGNGHVSVGVRVKLRPKPSTTLPSLELPQAQLAEVNQQRWLAMRMALEHLLADLRLTMHTSQQASLADH